MSIFTKTGCYLIGWDPYILATCGEASKRQFRKILSAVLIMMILWGTIGYGFAADYLNFTSFWAKAGVALAFMVIVLSIERVIILSSGKNWFMAVMRVALALCMALLGASIFDQFIFKNDIQHEVAAHREEMIAQTVKKRLASIDADIDQRINAIDSISRRNEALYKEIEANPATTVTSVSSAEQVIGTTDNGKPIKTTVRNVNKTVIPNARIEQVKGNDEQIKIYTEQLDHLRIDKRDVEKTTRKEIEARKPGFIEELEATIRVISHSGVSIAFYCVMFFFLLFLEMFVLTIKMGEKTCDYELIVSHQLNHKSQVLENTEKALIN